jgi:hypothetical protein
VTLSVADIDRWNPGDVREVFHATRSRAEAAKEAANGIAQLPAFGTWGGDASQAAKDAIGQTRKDMDAHGNETLAVARAADRAADDIEGLKGKLSNLRNCAHRLRMELDAATNSFVPAAGSSLTAADVALAEAELQPQLTALLAEAAGIDDELAQAINMATGKTPIPQTGPVVDPEGLTPTQVASDANQARLERERASTRAQVDQLQRQIDELALRTYTTGDHSTATFDRLHELRGELSSATTYLNELNAVRDALGKAPETYLTAFDPRTGTGKHVLAAVAVGNPDAARNVSVTVPGLGSTTLDTLPGMVSEAQNLRLEAERQMRNAGVPGAAAAIAWMGYDPPPNPLNTLSPRDALATIGDGQARAGADNLSSYLEQVRSNNPTGHITLFGHSYGSLTSSLALQELNAQRLHPVNDVVFYGSPGLELTSPDQLGLGAGHAYVMRGVDDPIATAVAELAPLHGWGVNPYDGMLPQLSAQAGIDPGGVLREGVQTHSDYARLGSDNQLRMSGYNLAAVMAGLPNNVAMAPPPPAPIPPPQPPLIPGVPGR